MNFVTIFQTNPGYLNHYGNNSQNYRGWKNACSQEGSLKLRNNWFIFSDVFNVLWHELQCSIEIGPCHLEKFCSTALNSSAFGELQSLFQRWNIPMSLAFGVAHVKLIKCVSRSCMLNLFTWLAAFRRKNFVWPQDFCANSKFSTVG